MMSHIKLINEYLLYHPVARNMENDHIELLRRVLSVCCNSSQSDGLHNTAVLMSFCSEQLKSAGYPEPAIARIATKAAELLFGEAK